MKSSKQTRNIKTYFLSMLLFSATVLLTSAGYAQTSTTKSPTAQSKPAASPQAKTSEKLELMFVQTSDDLKVDTAKKTIRLVNVGSQTLYFADRPQRVAGNIPMNVYLDSWKAGSNPDSFAADPPNATLSIIEPGQKKNTLVVVEISKPVVEGKDLIYSYKLIDGTMPKNGGKTTIFIDWIGVGGGIGPGYHGVGVGTRGVGVYGGYGGPARVY